MVIPIEGVTHTNTASCGRQARAILEGWGRFCIATCFVVRSVNQGRKTVAGSPQAKCNSQGTAGDTASHSKGVRRLWNQGRHRLALPRSTMSQKREIIS